MSTTGEKLARLGELLNQAGAAAFERIGLAVEVFKDRQWVMDHFKDDEFKAAEHLNARYLGDLCGTMNFFRLMKIKERFPTIEDWSSYRFNLTAMSAIIDKEEKKDKPKREINRVTLKEYEELLQQKKHFEAMYNREKQLREQAEARARDLDQKLQQALREKAAAEGKVIVLERELDYARRGVA